MNKDIKIIENNKIYTLEQLCDFLEIEIPDEYENIKTSYVTDTTLFDKLENKDELIAKIKTISESDCQYNNFANNKNYADTKKRANTFKGLYLCHKGAGITHTDCELVQLFVQYLYCFKPLGYSVSNYFSYELFRRTLSQANTFASNDYRKLVFKVCNDIKFCKYLSNKVLFNRVYSKYVKRDWLYTRICSLNEFKEFIKKHPESFAKPIKESMGKGAHILYANEHDDIEKLFHVCYKKDLMVEEIIKNEHSINEFNESSVNTIRLYTLLPVNNEPIVICAVMRIGREGEIVDNHRSSIIENNRKGGLVTSVDVKTGIIKSDGIDNRNIEYKEHPDSSKTIKGFQIPQWDEIIRLCKEAALVVPQLRYISWDVAVRDDNTVEFIEGNSYGNINMAQKIDQTGKKHLFEQHIKELQALKSQTNNKSTNKKPIKKSSPKKPKTPTDKKMKILGENRVFTINEICDLLEINTPKEYESIKNKNVTTTLLKLPEVSE